MEEKRLKIRKMRIELTKLLAEMVVGTGECESDPITATVFLNGISFKAAVGFTFKGEFSFLNGKQILLKKRPVFVATEDITPPVKGMNIFLVRCEKDNSYKIAHSKKPLSRLAILQEGSRHKLDIVACCKDDPVFEQELFEKYALEVEHGSWFTLNEEKAKGMIEDFTRKRIFLKKGEEVEEETKKDGEKEVEERSTTESTHKEIVEKSIGPSQSEEVIHKTSKTSTFKSKTVPSSIPRPKKEVTTVTLHKENSFDDEVKTQEQKDVFTKFCLQKWRCSNPLFIPPPIDGLIPILFPKYSYFVGGGVFWRLRDKSYFVNTLILDCCINNSKILYWHKNFFLFCSSGKTELWNFDKGNMLLQFTDNLNPNLCRMLTEKLFLLQDENKTQLWDIDEQILKKETNFKCKDVVVDLMSSKKFPKGVLFLIEESKIEACNLETLSTIQFLPNDYSISVCRKILDDTENNLAKKSLDFIRLSSSSSLLPNGNYLYGNELWDSKLVKKIATLDSSGTDTWHNREFLPNNKILFSGGTVVRIYDLNDGKCLHEFRNLYKDKWHHSSNITLCKVFGDTILYYETYHKYKELFNLKTGKNIIHLLNHDDPVVFLENGLIATIKSSDVAVRILDPNTEKCANVFMAATPLGKLVYKKNLPNYLFVVAQNNKTVEMWNLKENNRISILEGSILENFEIEILEHNRLIAYNNSNFNMWDYKTGKILFQCCVNTPHSFKIINDKWLLSERSEDSKFWNIETKECLLHVTDKSYNTFDKLNYEIISDEFLLLRSNVDFKIYNMKDKAALLFHYRGKLY